MRDINEVILHYTATPPGRDIDIEDVRRYHTQGNNWSDVGYHYLIKLDGTLQAGRPLEVPGAHCKGRNARTIGVAYVGGILESGKAGDTLSCEQEETLEHLFFSLQLVLCRALHLSGHNEYSSKACPGFSVAERFPRYRIK